MIYGYARVSTRGQAKDGNSLEYQARLLREAGAEQIYSDSFTGTKADRPEFNKLIDTLEDGDTLIVTKLDRFARSLSQGSELITELIERGIKVNVLNLGVMDNSSTGKLIRNIFLAFAEFERDLIIQRTTEGKEIARKNPYYTEGRPKKYSSQKLDLAMELLKSNSFSQVAAMTGISRSTLLREHKRRKDLNI